MNNISRFHSLKAIGAIAGFSLLAGVAMAQNVEGTDTVAVAGAAAQRMPYQVKGRVSNAATGAGFAGAQITSPNLKVSAMTDENGDYSIGLPSLDVPLYVTAPGFSRQVVPVKGRERVDVVLLEQYGKGYYDEALSISAGEANIGGFSSGTLSMTDDMTTLLNGQLRAVARSGEPGSSASFFIRGYNSLNMSSQPLFVVDGVIWQMQEDATSAMDNYVNNPLTLLDPADIEKVTILKNGSAIWGAKGANGVVLITTKRAHEMATKIEANISVGFQTPFKTLPMMKADSYRRYATDVMRGMDKDEVEKLQFISDDNTKSYYYGTHNDTDWFDEITKTSLIQNYGISVSGGDDIALYHFSLGYAKNDGNIDGTSFNRLNMRFNSDIKLTDEFSILADISYSQTNHKVVFDGLDATHAPYYLSMIKSPLYHPYQYTSTGALTGRQSDTDELNVGNPLALTGDGIPELEKYRFNLNLRPTYKFTDRLMLSALFGLSYDKENEDFFIPDLGVADTPLYTPQGEVYGTVLNEVRNMMARQTSMSVDAFLGWDILKDWRNDLNVKLGGRFYNTYYRYTSGVGYNTGSDYLTGLNTVTDDNYRFLNGFEYKDRNGAWYLDASYGHKNRYFLNAGVSVETSSRFGKDAGGLDLCGVSWGVFPSVSGAWLVSSEKFMKNVKFIDNLKLRVAYTVAGNDNLPVFANRTYFTSELFVRNAAGLVLANIGNEHLKWETVSRANVGVDFSLLNNRLAVNADYFYSKTKDLLTRKSLNDVAGLQYYWSNDGELENRGFEIALSARVVDTRDFKFNVGATIGHYRNEVTRLASGDFTTDICNGQVLTAVGLPLGMFYGYKTEGVFSTAKEAADANLSVKSSSGQLIPFSAGDMHFYDKNGDHVIGDEDRVVIGDPNPDIYGNFSLNFKWKRLEVGAIFTYSVGNDAYNAFRAALESGSSLYNQTTAMENRWMADGQQTDIPRATYGDPMGNARFSDRWIEDASYLKFKRLSLSYSIPFRTDFLQNITVWAAANNLCTLTKYMGSDPEFSYGPSALYQGIDGGLTPSSRSFQLGVKISL